MEKLLSTEIKVSKAAEIASFWADIAYTWWEWRVSGSAHTQFGSISSYWRGGDSQKWVETSY